MDVLRLLPGVLRRAKLFDACGVQSFEGRVLATLTTGRITLRNQAWLSSFLMIS